ncbi:hypothetical protein [Streptomyces hydrogenans]|uniref:hypothetical protein n=1 Tax=Streptomyces hydrogenans TaxID=1873719 RepID=UPI00342E14A3
MSTDLHAWVTCVRAALSASSRWLPTMVADADEREEAVTAMDFTLARLEAMVLVAFLDEWL